MAAIAHGFVQSGVPVISAYVRIGADIKKSLNELNLNDLILALAYLLPTVDRSVQGSISATAAQIRICAGIQKSLNGPDMAIIGMSTQDRPSVGTTPYIRVSTAGEQGLNGL